MHLLIHNVKKRVHSELIKITPLTNPAEYQISKKRPTIPRPSQVSDELYLFVAVMHVRDEIERLHADFFSDKDITWDALGLLKKIRTRDY